MTNFALGLGPPQGILYGALFGAVAGAVGPPLAGAYGGGFGGAVGAGATLGGAFGGISAAIAGGNVLEGLAGGAIAGAVVSASVYGGYQLAEQLASPTAAEAGVGRHQDPHADKWSTRAPADVEGADAWPTNNMRLTDSGYGSRHPAWDIAGTEARATGSGEVFAFDPGTSTRAGFVQLRIQGGFEVYAHVQPAPGLAPRMHVNPGQLLGTYNRTGITTGPHIHYELRGPDGTRYNPIHRLYPFFYP